MAEDTSSDWERHASRLRRFSKPGEPREGPFFKGYAFLFSNGAHGTIASSSAISLASRVV